MKATPGPWTVVKVPPYEQRGDTVFADMDARPAHYAIRYQFITDNGLHATRFVGEAYVTFGYEDEAEHNVNLMAAAPDLYGALDAIVRTADQERVRQLGNLWSVAVDALAKAEGKK